MFRAIKIKPYGHVAEEEQFEDIRQLLKARYMESEDSCLLLGNFNIEGAELDALLFLPGMIRVLEFKNRGGRIVARENGPWLADNKIIAGGVGKSPFEQARVNRSKVTLGLANWAHKHYNNVSASIIFRQDSQIDTSGLSETTRKWLKVCDNAHLAEILQGGGTVAIGNQEIDKIPKQFGIDNLPADLAQTYQTSAQEFFRDVEAALSLAPNFQRVYKGFGEVFRMVLNQHTASTSITFSSTYSKEDYLLKEHGADIPLKRAVNDLRARLNRRAQGGVETKELEQYRFNDMKALCEFIAMLHKVEVPVALVAVYKDKLIAPSQRVVAKRDYMRVLVSRWDETFLYGTWDKGNGVDEVKICYTEDAFQNKLDGPYLRKMLYEGASVNVVPPFERDGIIYGSYLIFEPDCLISVQAIARCFTEYADSPMVALIRKLAPSPVNDAITLGNFAGQLLDKALRESKPDYNQCEREFYKDNALSYLDLKDAASFHKEAQNQKLNIERLLNKTLPMKQTSFDKSNGMVEPSFFSEMLGLQGRMDYLQLDFKLLMEQKSGKGQWPDDYPHRTNARPEHLIQILLYMLIIRYNYHAIYRANNEALNSYLLYSKYEDPLVKADFIPRLAQAAIKIRNGLANLELQSAQEGSLDFLSTLSPDALNLKNTTSDFWNNSLRPPLARVLSPIQAATDLERSYFLRFLTFLSKEQLLSKMGNKSKECSGFAAAWHNPLEAKLAAGNIYTNLHLQEPTEEQPGAGIRMLRLTYTESEDHVMSNFRKGDIVVLYPYEPGKTPDLRTTMVFRSIIDRITSDTITLRLRAPQSPRAFAAKKGCLWAFEHDFMESSSNSLYKGLHAFLSAPKSRRDLILLQREPQIDTTATLTGDYGDFNDLVLRVKQARDLFLIIGPPGTGKTSYGMLDNVLEELHTTPNSSILLLSYTNRAVDEICSKLDGADIDYIRIGSEESCDEAYKDRLLNKMAAQTSGDVELRELICDTRVFVATTASLNSKLQILSLKTFSLCIVDEASQILEPHLIGILAACEGDKPAVEKLVLIGDHKQLPAVVQQDKKSSAVSQALLNDIGLTNCRDSLFERLLRRYGSNPAVTYMLTRQGRMHAAVAQFASCNFYDGKLVVVRSAQQQALPHMTQQVQDSVEQLMLTRNVIFLDAAQPKATESMKVNDVEARLIAHTALLAYKLEDANIFSPTRTIGIIVPYRNQIATVRNAIQTFAQQDATLTQDDCDNLAAITIDTVERFQGSEREWIIYGFTVQRRYQLNFLTDSTFIDDNGREIDRKLNVVVTRAKNHLILIGHSPLLEQVPTFRKLIDFVRGSGGYMCLR